MSEPNKTIECPFELDGTEGLCPRCCGEGFIEYDDCPEEQPEGFPTERSHLVTCPECGGEGEL